MSQSGSSVTNSSTPAQSCSTMAVPLGSVSQASADRAAAARQPLSRQPSVTSGVSGTSTPARQSLETFRHPSSGQQLPNTAFGAAGTLFTLPHRPSLSRDPSFASNIAQVGTPLAAPSQHPFSPSPAQSPGILSSSTSTYRTEMEIVKAENESLRQRVRALERALRVQTRRSSGSSQSASADTTTSTIHTLTESTSRTDGAPSVGESTATPGRSVAAWAAGNDGGVGGVAGPRERSESWSTTASGRRGGGGGASGEGVEEVRVGESAGSVGMGRGG